MWVDPGKIKTVIWSTHSWPQTRGHVNKASCNLRPAQTRRTLQPCQISIHMSLRSCGNVMKHNFSHNNWHDILVYNMGLPKIWTDAHQTINRLVSGITDQRTCPNMKSIAVPSKKYNCSFCFDSSSSTHSFLKYFYLFMAVLCLHCCERALSSHGAWASHCHGFSSYRAPGFRYLGLRSCHVWA